MCGWARLAFMNPFPHLFFDILDSLPPLSSCSVLNIFPSLFFLVVEIVYSLSV